MTVTDDEHRSITTNAALVALALGKPSRIEMVVVGKTKYVVLGKEPQTYTKTQATSLLGLARTQSIGVGKYCETLPTGIKACLALTYTLKGGDHAGTSVPLWAHALNSSTGFRTDAGKAIRAAKADAVVAATGGWMVTGHEALGVFHSKKVARKAAISAVHGGGWWKMDNAGDLRAEFGDLCYMPSKASAAPAPAVSEAPSATITDAALVTMAQALGSKASTGVGARKFLASRGINL